MVIFGKRVVNAIWRLFGIYHPFFILRNDEKNKLVKIYEGLFMYFGYGMKERSRAT